MSLSEGDEIRRKRNNVELWQGYAHTIRTLVDAGFTPASVVGAVEKDDISLLEHSGLFSVQLQRSGV